MVLGQIEAISVLRHKDEGGPCEISFVTIYDYFEGKSLPANFRTYRKGDRMQGQESWQPLVIKPRSGCLRMLSSQALFAELFLSTAPNPLPQPVML